MAFPGQSRGFSRGGDAHELFDAGPGDEALGLAAHDDDTAHGGVGLDLLKQRVELVEQTERENVQLLSVFCSPVR